MPYICAILFQNAALYLTQHVIIYFQFWWKYSHFMCYTTLRIEQVVIEFPVNILIISLSILGNNFSYHWTLAFLKFILVSYYTCADSVAEGTLYPSRHYAACQIFLEPNCDGVCLNVPLVNGLFIRRHHYGKICTFVQFLFNVFVRSGNGKASISPRSIWMHLSGT